MSRFNIYVCSYNRPTTTTTYKLLDYCTYVVRKSQEEDYRNAGIESIWAIDDELIDSAFKVYDYVSRNAPEEVIALCDDDIMSFVYRGEENEDITDPHIATSEIERLAQLTEDLRIGYLTTDSTPRPFGYDQPFGFSVGSSGAFKIINRNYYKAQMDIDVFYCCDIDCVLQELMANRIVLHPKYFLARAKIDKNAGGLSSTRVRSAVMNSVTAMENKWGQYFSYNFAMNTPNIRVKR